ncbi:YkgJ family cysteine cluster protein [Synechococcus sp. GFB01]|uniref:YkgJ family cysteine cluster protein n=1 Tax=Synechococcus sp. GFB01 TaxID=1662190 RepID=UPI00064F31FD|nr:YkgJ family cysteine cluster protein [Synechococcus sp. GFB01]KMM17031.1 Fe-S cluster protein [Synechococcus sp. GFB01]
MSPSRSGPSWRCIEGCGACCRLDPGQRPEALEALSPEQRERYLALVGSDGWCIHYDSGGRRCRIYEERPDFCRVANLISLFGSTDREPADADALAIHCCLQHIRSEYGGRSREMKRFLRALRQQS